MARIAFMSTFPPEPLTSGFSMRVHGMLLSVPPHHEVFKAFPKNHEQKLFPPDVSFSPGGVSRLLEAVSPVPRIVLDYYSSPGRAEVTSKVRSFKPDVVIASGIHVAPFVPEGIPFIYDAHNIEWHLARRLLEHSKASVPVRIHRLLTCLKLRKWEEQLVRHCSGMIACSVTDAKYFQSIRKERVPVVFNGVDYSYWRTERHPLPGELLFCGDMGYYPNEEAAMDVVNTVLPILRSRGWTGRFVICGKNPSPDLQDIKTPDVEVTGIVEDVRPYYRKACALIAPMKIGSGTPLKVLTAMGAGLPVVTTRRISESLGLEDKGVLVEADGSEETAVAALKLLGDPEFRTEISARGVETIRSRFDWKIVGSDYWEQVEHIIQGLF